jgi:hypothetical protein
LISSFPLLSLCVAVPSLCVSSNEEKRYLETEAGRLRRDRILQVRDQERQWSERMRSRYQQARTQLKDDIKVELKTRWDRQHEHEVENMRVRRCPIVP